MRNIPIFKDLREAVELNRQRARANQTWHGFLVTIVQKLFAFDKRYKKLLDKQIRPVIEYRRELTDNIKTCHRHIQINRNLIRNTNFKISKIPLG